jgi:predicted amidohydrolase
MRDQAGEARSRGAEIIVFPELALTGYLPAPEVLDHCHPLDGDGVASMREVAREHAIAIVFGLPELTDGIRYNTMLALDATGTIAGIYRKIHLWKTEDWAQPGTSIKPYELAGVACASWICYDTRFPEIGRAAALAGADLCVISTAWLGPGDEWELAVRSRALDNTVFVAGSDIINPDPSLRTCGRSLIVSPKGHVLARAAEDTPGVIVADLDPEEQQAQKDRVPLLDDRRLETLLDMQEGRDPGRLQSVAGSSRGPAIWRPGA